MTDHEYGALVRQWNLWEKKIKLMSFNKNSVPVTQKRVCRKFF